LVIFFKTIIAFATSKALFDPLSIYRPIIVLPLYLSGKVSLLLGLFNHLFIFAIFCGLPNTSLAILSAVALSVKVDYTYLSFYVILEYTTELAISDLHNVELSLHWLLYSFDMSLAKKDRIEVGVYLFSTPLNITCECVTYE